MDSSGRRAFKNTTKNNEIIKERKGMTTLKIEEMSCNHCVKAIGDVLTGLSIKHTISLEDKTVVIDATEADVENAITQLDDIGYTAVIA
jgi:copper chaperone